MRGYRETVACDWLGKGCSFIQGIEVPLVDGVSLLGPQPSVHRWGMGPIRGKQAWNGTDEWEGRWQGPR